jgi:aminoglycoside phosphotransferase (APT) family kinase protein
MLGKSVLVFTSKALLWLSQASGIPVEDIHYTKMKGATSSSVFLIENKSKPQQKYVLRVLDNKTWLKEEPDAPIHEAEVLKEVENLDVHSPICVSYSMEEVGFGAPVVLMSFLQGKINLHPVDFDDWLKEIAEVLAKIHHHKPTQFSWTYKSWVDFENLAVPAWTKKPAIWEKAINIIRKGPPSTPTVFIHRDFHPTNVLWAKEKLTGIVDWINACLGPAGEDVGHCKTNLVQMFGLEAAQKFFKYYQKANPEFKYEPYWDIETVLDMCFPKPSFYEPWHEFGLERISDEVLQTRIDEYLETLIVEYEKNLS